MAVNDHVVSIVVVLDEAVTGHVVSIVVVLGVAVTGCVVSTVVVLGVAVTGSAVLRGGIGCGSDWPCCVHSLKQRVMNTGAPLTSSLFPGPGHRNPGSR